MFAVAMTKIQWLPSTKQYFFEFFTNHDSIYFNVTPGVPQRPTLAPLLSAENPYRETETPAYQEASENPLPNNPRNL